MTIIDFTVILFLVTCWIFGGIWVVIGVVIGVMDYYQPKHAFWLVLAFIFWPIAVFVMEILFACDVVRELIRECKESSVEED